MGRRKPGTGVGSEDGKEAGISQLFEDGKWDSGKMVRSFARVGAVSKDDVVTIREGVSRARVYRLLLPWIC